MVCMGRKKSSTYTKYRKRSVWSPLSPVKRPRYPLNTLQSQSEYFRSCVSTGNLAIQSLYWLANLDNSFFFALVRLNVHERDQLPMWRLLCVDFGNLQHYREDKIYAWLKSRQMPWPSWRFWWVSSLSWSNFQDSYMIRTNPFLWKSF